MQLGQVNYFQIVRNIEFFSYEYCKLPLKISWFVQLRKGFKMNGRLISEGDYNQNKNFETSYICTC